ncbi:Soluble epoxide hydrolase [Roseobacter fucihabitans]|uniref:Soluble epoxide hydrolase n=1 Tax=Roseobacter fucihabitans TaxID=1537242 RepID=A0ABZ2BNR6_9RHOB|nr:alpha/beta fold hydrolase BchO [Roseobacter litoralis]MBC6963514.1 Soluble epoxide hydrolase [Roseobacter litoralis]
MRWPAPPDWPNADISQQILCAPHRWHVQETGNGPTILLLHGAGGSTHSFRALIPLLARSHHVVAIDLPGQGFTQLGARHRCGLDVMATDIAKLCMQQGWKPRAIIGHSAGGALALELSQNLSDAQGLAPLIIGINPALDTFDGIAGVLFPVIAKMLAALPFSARFFSAASANPARIAALITGTGSTLDAEGLDLYRRLVADRNHVDATLLMMSQWDLIPLSRRIETLQARTLFIVGENDKAVPPKVARTAAQRMPDARLVEIASNGHLVHEEAPGTVAAHILEFLGDLK